MDVYVCGDIKSLVKNSENLGGNKIEPEKVCFNVLYKTYIFGAKYSQRLIDKNLAGLST